jgi:hypothetical protein
MHILLRNYPLYLCLLILFMNEKVLHMKIYFFLFIFQSWVLHFALSLIYFVWRLFVLHGQYPIRKLPSPSPSGDPLANHGSWQVSCLGVSSPRPVQKLLNVEWLGGF